MRNLITDVEGVFVGSSEDQKLLTGVTVISGNKPFITSVDVRGGGPGTKETDMLKLENSVGRADAIVLSGGSSFGLEASVEVQKLLLKLNKGYIVNKNIIPLVPSAVIFDLNSQINYWDNNESIWKKLARKAFENLNFDFKLGSKGAGINATTATVKGGLGSASSKQKLSNNKSYTVGAIVINNAVGNPLLNEGPNFLSGYLEINDEFGGLGSSNKNIDYKLRAKRIKDNSKEKKGSMTSKILPTNTVLGVVATDAPLDRNALKRLAIMSHDGIARSIYPSHTPIDGDTIFAITNKIINKDNFEEISNLDLLILGSSASDCIARACNRAVYEASISTNIKPTWKQLFNN